MEKDFGKSGPGRKTNKARRGRGPRRSAPLTLSDAPAKAKGARLKQASPPSPPRILGSLRSGDDCAWALEALPSIFDEVIPLRQKQRLELGRSVRSLWEELTSEKEHRNAEYLGSPSYSSAYIRYFLPWNLMRLASVFPGLDLPLEEGAVIVDMGSGPLTVPMALYIARPDLRGKRLTIYCCDKTERILKTGQAIFENLCVRLSGGMPPWNIITLRQQFGAYPAEKADFFSAANVFNEFFWKSKTPLGMRSLHTARRLLAYVKDSGSVFLMEPGDPRSGTFISALRAALAAFGARPAAPCPHERACPMPGFFHGLKSPGFEAPLGAQAMESVVMPKKRDKYPWCHFTIGTEAAPLWLKKLSDEAGLPKEKLVFSYLFAALPPPGPGSQKLPDQAPRFRIISEAFPLPGAYSGRYACSARGYSLLRYPPERYSFASGDLVAMPAQARAQKAEAGRAGFQGARPAGSQGAGRALKQKAPLAPSSSGQDKTVEIDEKSGAILISY